MNDLDYKRIGRSATFTLDGQVEDIFPLFGPVREKEWVEGWEPEIIYSSTGVVDLHMIFRTNARTTGESCYTWVVSQFIPETFFIEYTVFTPLRIWFVSVQCVEQAGLTLVTVTYTFTNTTHEGKGLNDSALKEMFVHDLRDWQEAISNYLKAAGTRNDHRRV